MLFGNISIPEIEWNTAGFELMQTSLGLPVNWSMIRVPLLDGSNGRHPGVTVEGI